MAIYTRSGSILRNAGGGIWSNGASGGTDPYPWYTALDRNIIPFHTASGAWGAQVELEAPTGPTTSTSNDVSTAGGLETQLAVSGNQITCTGNFGTVNFNDDITDVDLIIPPGITIGPLNLSGTVTRFRIRGSTAGSHSGGVIAGGLVTFFNGSDVILDGIDFAYATIGNSSHMLFQHDNMARVAIVNTRMRSNSGGGLFSKIEHFVVCGNNWLTAESASRGGGDQGWCFRMGASDAAANPIVFFRNQLYPKEIPTFQCIRFDVSGASSFPRYGWVAENDLMCMEEGNQITTRDFSGAEAVRWNAIWGLRNRNYSDVNCAYNAVGIIDYARFTDNEFYSPTTQSNMDSSESACPASDTDFTTGNTYTTFSSLPAWSGPGDPTDITL